MSSSRLEVLFEDEYFNGDEIQIKLHKIIDELKEKQRRVFQMKFFDNMSFRQISDILEVSESTLKSTYYTVVKIIEKKNYESHYPIPEAIRNHNKKYPFSFNIQVEVSQYFI